MKGLLTLLSDIIESQVVQRAQEGAKNGAMIFAATLLFVGAFVALMMALYSLLAQYMTDGEASLIIAAVFVLTGVVLILIVMRGQSRGNVDGNRRAKTAQDLLEEKTLGYIRDNAVSATLLALLAGTTVGSNPELRRLLLRAIDRATAPPRDNDPL